MYYITEVEGVARVPPTMFKDVLEDAILNVLKETFEGQVDQQLGRIIAILDVKEIGEGIVIPGDGAAYHRTKFTVLNFLPEQNEIIEGEIRDIAKFGAFVDFGPFEGMVHISQTMDDFVTFSKSGALTGKKTNKLLKKGDLVRARIVAISFKDPANPKLGLTMRQPYLGKLDWIDELVKKSKGGK